MSIEKFTDALTDFCKDKGVEPLVCLCEGEELLCSFFNMKIPKERIIKALKDAAFNLENDMPADVKIHLG